MKSVTLQRVTKPLSGELLFPGDKSLSHRAIIFGALAEGTSSFTNVLSSEDCVCTLEAFRTAGVDIDAAKDMSRLKIKGKGLRALRPPKKDIYLGNSGTSMRLLSGVFAGQPFEATLTGDPSLSKRPMRRVTDYLKKMGASVEGREEGNYAPLKIKGGSLKGISADLPIASAQVKSALLLAGLYAEGRTRITEPFQSRDHTEKFLQYFGAEVIKEGLSVSIRGGQTLKAPGEFRIAGDISSAAFFMAAAVLVPGSKLKFKSVLWNPTRTGIIEVMKRMGVEVLVEKLYQEGPEQVADFTLKAPLRLKPFDVLPAELPSLIDEIPVLAVLATQAGGTSIVHEADELRVKETDRIDSMVSALSAMGANISAKGNSLIVHGPTPLVGARVDSQKDHRTAMASIVAGMVADGSTTVDDVECINTSFPDFFTLFRKAGAC